MRTLALSVPGIPSPDASSLVRRSDRLSGRRHACSRRCWARQSGWLRLSLRDNAAPSRRDFLRRGGRPVHTDVHLCESLSPDVLAEGMVTTQVGEPVGPSSTRVLTPGPAERAGDARVSDGRASRARRSVLRCLWRGLESPGEQALPADHRCSHYTSGRPFRTCCRREDAELRRVRHRSRYRREVGSPGVVSRVARMSRTGCLIRR
jgi:hypothetical protein